MRLFIAFCLYLGLVTIQIVSAGAILTRDKENILFHNKHEVLHGNE